MELNQGTKPGSPAYDKRTVNQGDPIQSGQSYPKSSMSQSKKKEAEKHIQTGKPSNIITTSHHRISMVVRPDSQVQSRGPPKKST
jgi:hypothetical protein